MAIVKVIERAREGDEAKRKNATLSDQQTDMEAEMVVSRAASRAMSSQILAAEERVKFLKTRLAES